MTDTQYEPSGDDEHECQSTPLELTQGDSVLINERSRPLTVDDQHKRQNQSSTWKRRGVAKYRTIFELAGNGTKYHLLCTAGSAVGPMLYKESEWDEDRTDKLGQSPKYSRSGEPVESIEVVD